MLVQAVPDLAMLFFIYTSDRVREYVKSMSACCHLVSAQAAGSAWVCTIQHTQGCFE